MIKSCKNWVIQGNSAKSSNNPMSSFGLSEQNMELSPIYQAVLKRQYSMYTTLLYNARISDSLSFYA